MDIVEEKLQWEQPVEGFQYKIQSGADAPLGDAQLIYKYSDQVVEEVRLVLSARGIGPTDKIVHLNEFYPNGRGLNEKTGAHMRRGVGTRVLAFLIQSAVYQQAKAMYVFSMKPSMQSFLKKNGFESFGPKICHHIKVLEEEQS